MDIDRPCSLRCHPSSSDLDLRSEHPPGVRIFNLQLQCNQPVHQTQATSGEKEPSNPQNRSFFYLFEIPQLPANFAHFYILHKRANTPGWLPSYLQIANHLIQVVLFEFVICGYTHRFPPVILHDGRTAGCSISGLINRSDLEGGHNRYTAICGHVQVYGCGKSIANTLVTIKKQEKKKEKETTADCSYSRI